MHRGRIALAATGLALAVGVPATTAYNAPDPPLRGGLSKQDGHVVPSIAGVDPISGRTVSLSRWKGKPVVINVWGSWCSPCWEEAPQLARFARAHPRLVLGLDIQDSRVGAKRFYARYRLPYPSIFDPRAKLFKRLAVVGVPTTMFLDRRHRLVATLLGQGSVPLFERGLRLATR